jgi:hypothetical protein
MTVEHVLRLIMRVLLFWPLGMWTGAIVPLVMVGRMRWCVPEHAHILYALVTLLLCCLSSVVVLLGRVRRQAVSTEVACVLAGVAVGSGVEFVLGAPTWWMFVNR